MTDRQILSAETFVRTTASPHTSSPRALCPSLSKRKANLCVLYGYTSLRSSLGTYNKACPTCPRTKFSYRRCTVRRSRVSAPMEPFQAYSSHTANSADDHNQSGHDGRCACRACAPAGVEEVGTNRNEPAVIELEARMHHRHLVEMD